MSEVEPTITLLIIPLIQSFCMSKRILLFLHKHITHTHTHTLTHTQTHVHTHTHQHIQADMLQNPVRGFHDEFVEIHFRAS